MNEWLNGAVVDHSIARRRRIQNLLREALILGEQIQTQGARPRLDEIDHLLDVVNLQDWKDRTKDLFLHHRRLWGYVYQHGRRDEPVRAVMLAAEVNRSARKQAR